MSSWGLHEGRTKALINYLGPETGPSRFHRRIACLSLVALIGWGSLELSTNSRNQKKNNITDMMTIHPACLVSGIDPTSSPFRTCSHPHCLVPPSDYMWGSFCTYTSDWLNSTSHHLKRASNAVLMPRAQGWWAEAKHAQIGKPPPRFLKKQAFLGY